MSEILSGLSGRKYTIVAHIKLGGEGGVYETDIPEVAAKLYDTSKINVEARMSEMENHTSKYKEDKSAQGYLTEKIR